MNFGVFFPTAWLSLSISWSCCAQASTVATTSVYERAAKDFFEADFFKPISTNTDTLTSKLAPLIFQEVLAGTERKNLVDAGQWSGRFGTLGLSNGLLTLNSDRPTIYCYTDNLDLRGRPHARCTYLWCYALKPLPQGSSLALQGCRLTLDSAGQPAIWEILVDDSAAQLMFIAQRLEAAARAEFGEPLPGRRYAAESAEPEAQGTIIARVIEHGPTPMGPMIYLSAETHTVSTLICRCMPPQAKNLRTTETFGLLDLAGPPATWLITRAKLLSKTQTAFWPGEPGTESRLEKCLRLPTGF